MSTVDQGLDLSPEKLFRFEDEKLAGRHAGERRGGDFQGMRIYRPMPVSGCSAREDQLPR